MVDELRFYLPSSGTAAVSPTYSEHWDKIGGSLASGVRRPTSTTKAGTSIVTEFANQCTSAAGPVSNTMGWQYVSDQFTSAVRLGGRMNATVAAYLGSGTRPYGWLQLIIRVVDSTGATTRGYLTTGSEHTAASLTPGEQNQTYPYGSPGARIWDRVPISTVTAQAGDRLVIELGMRTEAFADFQGWRPLFGDLGDDLDHVATDAPVTARVPWVQIGVAPTVAPPCRLFPRADDLGVGGGRRFPPPKSQQRSGRRFGYY